MPPRWTRKPGGRRVRVRKGNSGIPDDDDDDNGTGMCYTLASCRPDRLVSKQLFRP